MLWWSAVNLTTVATSILSYRYYVTLRASPFASEGGFLRALLVGSFYVQAPHTVVQDGRVGDDPIVDEPFLERRIPEVKHILSARLHPFMDRSIG